MSENEVKTSAEEAADEVFNDFTAQQASDPKETDSHEAEKKEVVERDSKLAELKAELERQKAQLEEVKATAEKRVHDAQKAMHEAKQEASALRKQKSDSHDDDWNFDDVEDGEEAHEGKETDAVEKKEEKAQEEDEEALKQKRAEAFDKEAVEFAKTHSDYNDVVNEALVEAIQTNQELNKEWFSLKIEERTPEKLYEMGKVFNSSKNEAKEENKQNTEVKKQVEVKEEVFDPYADDGYEEDVDDSVELRKATSMSPVSNGKENAFGDDKFFDFL